MMGSSNADYLHHWADLIHSRHVPPVGAGIRSGAVVLQGSLVRVVRREEELLRQLVSAARGIGEEALATKFEDGIAKIKRDIIFAASLYL